MRTPPAPRGAERGSLLLPVAVMVVLVAGLSLMLLYEGIAERTALAHTETSIQALDVAEGGLVRAEMEIFALADPDEDGIGNLGGEFGGGRYRVEAQQDPLFPDRWTLTARGERELSVRRLEVGVRRRQASAFVDALFARDGLVFRGSATTDSYDSTLGPWATQATNLDAGGPYARTNGHVGSNTALRALGTGARIRGNAIPGPLYTVDESGNPTILGDTVPRRLTIPVEDPSRAEFEAAYAANDNALLPTGAGKNKGYDPRTMSLSVAGGGTVTITGGTYFLTDVMLAGGSVLQITGPTVLYVTGDLNLGGGTLLNVSGDPGNLIIWQHPYAIHNGSAPRTPVATITGGPGAAFALYAPAVNVTLNGDADFYGAAVGRAIDVSGDATFHFDESLRQVKIMGRVTLERLYWRELSVPTR